MLLTVLVRQEAEFAIHRVRLNHYFHSNRPIHLLANKLCSNDQIADPATIESETAELLSEPK